ncbi:MULTISPECIES: DUF6263 family protein [Clostridium]|uniref:Lipoprotein n=1 Tax=Clostridium botulinum D str. 1873 TaxID=592027 RepID=A0A9P2G930_CLOBO|nr:MULTISPECIES: DUF6263 family protein [Clostridium]EES92202.1 putative lipoprotein [Clostridium botulinum D str. 1873]
MNKKVVILVIMFYICSILSGCIKIPIKLSINEKKGDSFKVEIDRNQKITSNFNGENSSVELKVREGFLCNVVNVDDIKDSDIKVTFDSINFVNNINISDKLKKYVPNANEDLKELANVYSSFLGKSFKVKIGENGKVKKIMGIDELTMAILKDLKDKSKEQYVKSFIKNEFSENALTAKIEKITLFYPEKRVAQNTQWRIRNTPSIKIPIQSINDYILKDSEDKTAYISIKSQIKKNESAQPHNIDDVKLSFEDIKGNGSGNINVNLDKGIIKNTDIQSKYKGNIKIVSMDPNTGTQMIPIIVEDKINVHVLNQ